MECIAETGTQSVITAQFNSLSMIGFQYFQMISNVHSQSSALLFRIPLILGVRGRLLKKDFAFLTLLLFDQVFFFEEFG